MLPVQKHDPGYIGRSLSGRIRRGRIAYSRCLTGKEALIEQEEDIDLETVLAALELESDTGLEETGRYRWHTKNHGSCGESSG